MTAADRKAADRVLTAACVEAIRQIRAGETSYILKLRSATEAAELLLDGAS